MEKKFLAILAGLILLVALAGAAPGQEMSMPGMSAPAQAQPPSSDIAAQLKQLQKELESIRSLLGLGPGSMAMTGPMMGMTGGAPGAPQAPMPMMGMMCPMMNMMMRTMMGGMQLPTPAPPVPAR